MSGKGHSTHSYDHARDMEILEGKMYDLMNEMFPPDLDPNKYEQILRNKVLPKELFDRLEIGTSIKIKFIERLIDKGLRLNDADITKEGFIFKFLKRYIISYNHEANSVENDLALPTGTIKPLTRQQILQLDEVQIPDDKFCIDGSSGKLVIRNPPNRQIDKLLPEEASTWQELGNSFRISLNLDFQRVLILANTLNIPNYILFTKRILNFINYKLALNLLKKQKYNFL
ncbi:hypothetical protein CHS0354_033515 [Potamilus streckersoni]|uniref:Uncharacterized protein n=1 Tax=Potamilus streckersoni TaxID=2493646 RepID=A0AAE0SBU4_9BIVA|nr:hypothetical protein CHS0354_033515 [Potamilus streckersoni]